MPVLNLKYEQIYLQQNHPYRTQKSKKLFFLYANASILYKNSGEFTFLTLRYKSNEGSYFGLELSLLIIMYSKIFLVNLLTMPSLQLARDTTQFLS